MSTLPVRAGIPDVLGLYPDPISGAVGIWSRYANQVAGYATEALSIVGGHHSCNNYWPENGTADRIATRRLKHSGSFAACSPCGL
jgi:hypothetical protein